MPTPNPALRKKANTKSPSIPTRNANPTSSVGKGVPKSSKTNVPANRNSNTNKSGKVVKHTGKNNPDQITSRSGGGSNRGAAKKSHRINYSALRKT